MSVVMGVLDRVAGLCGVRTVTRCASREFGPTPGARWARVLADVTDVELVALNRDQAIEVGRARAGRAAAKASQGGVR